MSPTHPYALQAFVDRLLARSVLDDQEQRAILSLPTKPVAVRARQEIIRLDEEVDYSCYIASGLVARFGETASGARQLTAFHIPGDMADLHSAVRPTGVGGLIALSNTAILRVPHGAIRSIAAAYPAIAEALWRDCMLDAAVFMQWIINVGRRNARTRLAHIFCEMATRSGGGREPLLEYALPISQEQFGDAAALTAVHVNRSLTTLRQDGLATFRSGIVQIHDWNGLARIGDFDPSYLTADTAPRRQDRLLQDA